MVKLATNMADMGDGIIDEQPQNIPAKGHGRITLDLICERSFPGGARKWSQEQIIERLGSLNRLRLDREHLTNMDGLQLVGSSCTFLYLQHNYLTEISHLQTLCNLEFLCLSSNSISTIQGLRHLSRLRFLDLSDNKISDFCIDEIPPSLMILNLSGNMCRQTANYRERVLKALPSLRQLDGEDIDSTENEDEEKEEDEKTDISPDNKVSLPLSTLGDILLRSQDRLEKHIAERRHEVSELITRVSSQATSRAGNHTPAPL